MTTAEQFVIVYMQEGGGLDNISNKLGVTRASVHQRLVKMRKAGVKLPVRRGRKGYNISQLNKLIREYK